MTFAHTTHHMGKVADTQQSRIVRTTPIIRLVSMSEACYLQGGHCYSDSGDEMELPPWAYGQMERLTPDALKEAGFTAVPTPPGGKAEAEQQVEHVPQPWQCPACEKLVEEGAKAAHIAKHNLRLGANDQLGPDGKPLPKAAKE